MESAPFDLSDTGSRPISPIPPDLVRVKSRDAKVGKVYYVKYITAPDAFEWLLSTVISNSDTLIKLGHVWIYGEYAKNWTPIGAGRYIKRSRIDTDIADDSSGSLYHLYTLAPRNLAPKPAPSGLSQRKTRRNNSRSRRNNSRSRNSRRRNSRRNH